MYGDTTVIRRLASRMDERATDLRATADQLSASADTAHWWSVSGERMRGQVRERAANLRGIAADYEDAADKLREHADKVDELKALISLIERKVTSLVEGAIDRIKDAGHAVVEGVKDGVKAVGDFLTGGGGDGPDPRDVQLARFASPPPGDKGWLDVPDQLGIGI
jgi:methyl-accepting chemotaxis protein